MTATSTTTTQISQQQLNGCEVVDNKSRQILINHSNDANVGVVAENYLHSQVKVSHHETPNEIRLESLKNLSESNQSGRKVSSDESGMVTIVTINNGNSSGVV